MFFRFEFANSGHPIQVNFLCNKYCLPRLPEQWFSQNVAVAIILSILSKDPHGTPSRVFLLGAQRQEHLIFMQ